MAIRLKYAVLGNSDSSKNFMDAMDAIGEFSQIEVDYCPIIEDYLRTEGSNILHPYSAVIDVRFDCDGEHCRIFIYKCGFEGGTTDGWVCNLKFRINSAVINLLWLNNDMEDPFDGQR